MRIHAFEFIDQPWFPGFLRDAGTAYLDRVLQMAKVPELAAEVLGALDLPVERWVDLGTGNGHIAVATIDRIRKEGQTLLLTDKFPDEGLHRRFPEDWVTVYGASVDARWVPPELSGARTLFNTLHHFRPTDVRRIFSDAQHHGQPIAVVEATDRTLPNLISALFIPLMVWLLMPTLKPKVSWLVFTYLIPILPLVIAWDGLVSHLRSYGEKELVALSPVEPGWGWQTHRIKAGPGTITVHIGAPGIETPAG